MQTLMDLPGSIRDLTEVLLKSHVFDLAAVHQGSGEWGGGGGVGG